MGLYEYEDSFAQMLLQYKDGFDEALAPVFLFPYRRRLRLQFRNSLLLCAPSSRSILQKRGFFPVKQLFAPLGLPMEACFDKQDEQRQRFLNPAARKQLQIKLLYPLPKQARLVLIDDVVTTGSTLLAMQAQLDRPAEALVLAIHPLLLARKNDRFRQGWKTILKKK